MLVILERTKISAEAAHQPDQATVTNFNFNLGHTRQAFTHQSNENRNEIRITCHKEYEISANDNQTLNNLQT